MAFVALFKLLCRYENKRLVLGSQFGLVRFCMGSKMYDRKVRVKLLLKNLLFNHQVTGKGFILRKADGHSIEEFIPLRYP